MDNYDEEHLRLLKLGHYIVAGITALFSCFPLIHLTVGIAFMINPPHETSGEPFPGRLFGLLFATIGGIFVIGGWTLATCIFFAGRALAARRRYTFCVIIAALCCAFFPFGTVLGVLSLLVLTRPTVKQLFAPASSFPNEPPASQMLREPEAEPHSTHDR